jgi:hypothetical protein
LASSDSGKNISNGESKSSAGRSESTGSNDDENVFKIPVTVPGIPTVKNKASEVCIHSGPGRKRAESLTSVISGSGSGTGAVTSANMEHKFPAAYYSVRKLRANSQPSAELQSITGDRRSDTKLPKNLPGFEITDDERQYQVKNFHVPALKKNVSSSVCREGSEIFCVTCDQKHNFDSVEPVCLILTDQNFTPMLPSDTGKCCIIIRMEDSFLSDLPGLL